MTHANPQPLPCPYSPCPFCGAAAREVPAHAGEMQRLHPAFDVECSNDRCDVQPSAQSAEAWNRRAALATAPLICRNCKFYTPQYIGQFGGWPAACRHPSTPDLVHGGAASYSPFGRRGPGNDCGPEGNLWEAKPAPEPKPRRWWQVFG